MRKHMRLATTFWGSLAVLAGCTPFSHEKVQVDWVVVNDTPDPMIVTVRFPLDSARVFLPIQAAIRQQIREDSAAHQGRGYLRQPFHRVTVHQDQWYEVNELGGWTNFFLDQAPTLRPA